MNDPIEQLDALRSCILNAACRTGDKDEALERLNNFESELQSRLEQVKAAGCAATIEECIDAAVGWLNLNHSNPLEVRPSLVAEMRQRAYHDHSALDAEIERAVKPLRGALKEIRRRTDEAKTIAYIDLILRP